MGITLRAPVMSVDRYIAAPAETVWRLLVDVAEWPRWGPSVRGAELQGGGREIGPGARGTVLTAAGVRLPFAITEFDAGRRWAWQVAGVPATGHEIVPATAGCTVSFDVPWWAGPYLVVCSAALGRIAELAVQSQ